jgi:NADPH:quinone reductase-like Zn-dependent oxidoreductase
MTHLSGRELRSLVTSQGRLKLWLDDVAVADPAADEVVVRIEAAPLNPSDIILLLGPADLATLHAGGCGTRPTIEAVVPDARLSSVAGRLDRPLPVGNEGAGLVVKAGEAAKTLLGRTVAVRISEGTYAQYRAVKASDCLVLPDGTSAREGAAAFINPLTALGMTETMRREGHHALVHTAAASNLGQMLNRLCRAEGIPLVNIVRNASQVELLRGQGATYVLDSTAAGFREMLVAALDETGATLAFDAIGGGTMAATILAAMEQVASRRLATYSRYGSPVHKQVYIYGMLDPGPKIIEGNLGMAWGVGGWLMTWFYEKIGIADAQRLRARVAADLTTTFASRYTAEISLAEALSPEMIRAYSRRATGEKYLIVPHGRANGR